MRYGSLTERNGSGCITLGEHFENCQWYDKVGLLEEWKAELDLLLREILTSRAKEDK